MSKGRPLSPEKLAQFIEALASTGNITLACRTVGVGRATIYAYRETDPDFAAAWQDALEEATDALEAEARRRALEGVEEYVTCKDGLVLDENRNPVMQRRYSDGLLTTLLRAHRPDKFRDRATVDMNVNANLASVIEEARKRVLAARELPEA